MEGHGFVHGKHETLHFLNESQSILNCIMKCNPFPTIVATKKVGPYLKGTFSAKFGIYMSQMIIFKRY
jgi:hypothetical protein